MKKNKKQLRLEDALVPVEEQPYEVPENWCWIKHNSILDISGGSQPAKSYFVSEPTEGYTQLYQTRDYGENPIPVFIPDKYATKTTVEGDILLARYGGSLGKVFRAHEGAYNVALAKVIKLYPELLDDEFLYNYYFTQFYQDFCVRASNGRSAQAGFNRDDMNSIPFPLPPLPEQQRIVERIESLFSKLDEAKEKAQEALESFEERQVAILHKAFKGELTLQWRTEHGLDMNSWRDVPLKDCGRWFGGGTPTTSKKEYWEGGDILWITSKDMKEKIIKDSLMHVTMVGVENSSANYCEEPAVLFVMRSGILRRVFPVSMVRRPFTVNQDLKACVPEGILQEYLYWHCTGFEKDIRDNCMKSGTTVESVEAKKLYEYEISVAGIDEQKEIVNRIEELLNKEVAAYEVAENVIESIELVKKSILAKAFRGELGTNNPSEESSIELLKQVIKE